jgi:hypothetical protein
LINVILAHGVLLLTAGVVVSSVFLNRACAGRGGPETVATGIGGTAAILAGCALIVAGAVLA